MTANPASPSSSQDNLQEFEDYVKTLKDTTPKARVTPPSQATPDQIDKLISTIADSKSITLDKNSKMKITTCICELLQIGGASDKFDRNIPSTVVSDITLTMKDVTTALKKVDPHLTPRKVARALQKEISIVATTWGIPGNLSKAYLTDHPNASIAELIYASDFFTFSKEDSFRVPENVKQWLVENYNSRWGKKKN